MTLAIIDSGVGGLSIFLAIKKRFPKSDLIYFADQAFMPYGEKDKKTLFSRGVAIISYLLEKGATQIVLGCHTLDTACGIYLKECFEIPIYSISESALQIAEKHPEVGILGTTSTINSHYFQNHLGSKAVFSLAWPKMAPQVEKGVTDSSLLLENIESLPRKDIPLLLACTHFSFLKKSLTNHLPSSSLLLDPADHLASQLPVIEGTDHDVFFTSSPTKTLQNCGESLIGRKFSSPYFVKSLYSCVNLKF